MKLLDDIVELAVDDEVGLSVILRKFLVVATKLQNARLKGWVLGELNGYDDRDNLPPYRVLRIQAKGLFLGPFQGELRNQPLPSGILDKDHRWWATTAYLMQGIAGLEEVTKKEGDGRVKIEWPGDLVVRYQEKFFEDWALNRARQDISIPSIASVIDGVRNRLLEFALELQEEIGDSEAPLEKIKPERLDSVVTTVIFGGHNVIAKDIAGDVKQIDVINVVQGNVEILARVLKEVGVPTEELGALKEAIVEDKQVGEKTGFGERTTKWLAKALAYAGKGSSNVVGGVAKATLTKGVMAYLGLQ